MEGQVPIVPGSDGNPGARRTLSLLIQRAKLLIAGARVIVEVAQMRREEIELELSRIHRELEQVRNERALAAPPTMSGANRGPRTG
jgi:hypothetical protein